MRVLNGTRPGGAAAPGESRCSRQSNVHSRSKPMQVLFDHHLITVWYHERLGIIHHQIHATIERAATDVFIGALEAGARALSERGVTKWLSDDRNQRTLPAELQEWARESWFPRARKAGWEAWAVVHPLDSPRYLHLAQLTSTFAHMGVRTCFFADVAPAMDWLAHPGGAASTRTAVSGDRLRHHS